MSGISAVYRRYVPHANTQNLSYFVIPFTNDWGGGYGFAESVNPCS